MNPDDRRTLKEGLSLLAGAQLPPGVERGIRRILLVVSVLLFSLGFVAAFFILARTEWLNPLTRLLPGVPPILWLLWFGSLVGGLVADTFRK